MGATPQPNITLTLLAADCPARKPSAKAAIKKPAHIRSLEDRARERFGTKVTIDAQGQRGKFVVHFYNDDDFQRVLDVLRLSD